MSANQSDKTEFMIAFVLWEVLYSLYQPMILEHKQERQNSQEGTHRKLIDQVNGGNLGKNNTVGEEEQEVID